MPKHLPPRSISAHRLAATALYRSLLSQCRASPLADASKNELSNLIRNRFRQQRHNQSTRRLRIAFCGAYEGLDKLDAAVAGDNASTTYIVNLLTRVPATVKQGHVRSSIEEDVGESQDAYFGPRRTILDRPRPLSELSGRRHVPRIVSAGGLPMLRIKKPQPRSLSGYFARQIKRRHRRTLLRHDFTSQMQTTKDEDTWDEIIADELPDEEQTQSEPSWQSEISKSRQHLLQHLDAQRIKDTQLARKMQQVVDAERIRVKIERTARRKVRRTAKLKEEKEKLRTTRSQPQHESPDNDHKAT